MNIQYKDMQIEINFKDTLLILNKSIDVLDINITKNNTTIKLGNFYSDINIEENIEYIINNIDILIFQRNRYLGNNDKIIDYLQEYAFNDIKIRDMYLEYINLDKTSIEYKKYSRFLEMYFCSHEISDNIRKIFLEKENKSILDYCNIDASIKNEFSGSIGNIREERDHEIDLNKLNKITIKKDKIQNELLLLNSIIENINNIINSLKEKSIINEKISKLKSEINNMHFFDKNKKNKKIEVFNLESNLNIINIIEYRKIIKELINDYIVKYEDSYGLNVLFEGMTEGELIVIVKSIFDNKLKQFEELNEEYLNLLDKVNNYEECVIDISDLYEKLENSKVKEQV